MYTKSLAIILTISAVLVLGVVITGSSAAVRADPGNGGLTDKCISSTDPNTGGTGLRCNNDVHQDTFSGEAKKECRESGDKCSSSQTANGELGNRFKKNCFGPNADPC